MYKLCRLILILTVLAFACCLTVVAIRTLPLSILAVIVCLCAAARQRHSYLTAFGTARWADDEDLRQAGMLDARTGLILGRAADHSCPSRIKGTRGLFNPRIPSADACRQFLRAFLSRRPRSSNSPLVRLPSAVHTAVFAPTGVGKGTSFVVPFLLTCPESCVVIDFKGENARLTADHRRRAFGHRIVTLDPFRVVTRQPDTFNPLDWIGETPEALDEARDLAEAHVIRTGQEKDPHWCDVAELWIAAMTALVVQYGEPGDRSLQTVRGLITDPHRIEQAIQVMCASEAWDGMLARLGHQLTHFKDKELASTLTTSGRFLRYLDTPAVAESTRASSFDPSALREGRMTIYLVLPPDHLRAQSPLLRMWIGAMLRAVVRGGLQEKNKVHFILDEAASLGHMEAIDDAVDKFRGYGVRLQFYYQSLGQLKKCFPEGQDVTLLSNTTQVFFGVNDPQTAEYVSGRLGEQTIVAASGGTSTGATRQLPEDGHSGSSYSRTDNDNWQQHGRRLLKPEEVMTLPERTAVTFTPGVPPIRTTLVRYYEERGLGQPPGRWERFVGAVKTLAMSLLLLASASLLAIAVAMASVNRSRAASPLGPGSLAQIQSQSYWRLSP